MPECPAYQRLIETAEASYQRGFQHGIELASCPIVLEFLLAVLEFRFDRYAVQALRPALENIKDLQQLQELYSEALRAETFEAFARTLGMNGNEE